MTPFLGHGAGLRPVHHAEVIARRPKVDWFEVISENFMVAGGNPRRVLREVRQHYPIVLHGVSMSLGSSDPLDRDYLDRLATLAAEVEPAWVSDHLCWSSLGWHNAHDLWPMPYTEEALAHVVGRIATVQERLGRRILVENVSTYLSYRRSEMSEWEFLAEVARRADCGLLVDVNNVYVSARNLGFDARAYLAALPVDRIGQIHLAGHSDEGDHLLDTHDAPVAEPVWALYRELVARAGRVSTLIEWDGHIPELPRLVEEVDRARAVAAGAAEGVAGAA
jgi:hypothetical protein